MRIRFVHNSAMEVELSPEAIMPETAKYTLRALLLQGSDIPVFKFPNAQVNEGDLCIADHQTTPCNGRRSIKNG